MASNLPANAPGAQPKAGTKSSTESTRTEETVNFEISKTTKTHVREAGIVNRLSVAVLIDGTYSDGEEGRAGPTQPQAESPKGCRSRT
ncbi:MAG: flagellar M-ring protein FliF C-terminal domain-containing protein [Candidatus Acidiferrales bacterium]